MYLKNIREFEIRELVAEIKMLASMEGIKLPDEIKEKIRPFVRKFDSRAERILDALDDRDRKSFQFAPHD